MRAQSLTIKPLEPNLSPATVLMDFHCKVILFQYCGAWVYRMAGTTARPSSHDTSVYGAFHNDTLALSTNVKKLIQWLDRRTR